MTLTFIQFAVFAARWDKFRLGDEDLQALEQSIMRNPEAGDVVAGTGGLRKMRFAPPSRHTGKSGAFRVGYAYFRVAGTVYLFTLFAKKDQANLTAAEKASLKAAIEWLATLHR